MVVNMKLFSPGEALPPGTLWVTEQIPGLVEFADTTQQLGKFFNRLIMPQLNMRITPTVCICVNINMLCSQSVVIGQGMRYMLKLKASSKLAQTCIHIFAVTMCLTFLLFTTKVVSKQLWIDSLMRVSFLSVSGSNTPIDCVIRFPEYGMLSGLQYQMAPRAQLFRRDQVRGLVTLRSFRFVVALCFFALNTGESG